MGLSNAAPDIKQMDFLKSYATLKNLITAPDNNKRKKIAIEPFNDYIGTGTAIDWTDKLDVTKDQVITSGVDIQNKTLEFTYTDDKDILNKFVKDKGHRTYGRKLIEDSENDFATTNKVIKTGFSPTPLNAIKGSTVIIPKFINDKGEPIDTNTRILFWCGLESIQADTVYAYDDTVSSSVALTQYGHFSHYSTKYPTVTDRDLNFGAETPFQYINAAPVNTSYVEYWQDYYNGIYSSDSKLLTAYMTLDIVDVYRFKFSDNIYIKNDLWRINKISGFDPTSKVSTKVEFVKILGTPRECE